MGLLSALLAHRGRPSAPLPLVHMPADTQVCSLASFAPLFAYPPRRSPWYSLFDQLLRVLEDVYQKKGMDGALEMVDDLQVSLPERLQPCSHPHC